MEYDIHSKLKALNAYNTRAIAANGTTAGNILDTKGFESLEFIGQVKTITDGSYTLLLEESDASDLSGSNVVAAEHTLGGLFVFSAAADNNKVMRTGYIGKKRYVRASIVAAGITTGVDMIGISAVMGHPMQEPVADQAS